MPKITKTPKKLTYTYAVGRRKEATARIRLFHGKGESLVNGMASDKYFPGKLALINFQKPFTVTDSLNKFYATIKVAGSGKNGQLTAVMHGLSRALDKFNPETYHKSLKQADLLTRDPRTRERRKIGMGGKSRRAKQSPKR